MNENNKKKILKILLILIFSKYNERDTIFGESEWVFNYKQDWCHKIILGKGGRVWGIFWSKKYAYKLYYK